MDVDVVADEVVEDVEDNVVELDVLLVEDVLLPLLLVEVRLLEDVEVEVVELDVLLVEGVQAKKTNAECRKTT